MTGEIDVAMIQSLVRKDEVADLVAGYGHVVVDECHHIPAASFERVLAEVKAEYARLLEMEGLSLPLPQPESVAV